MAETAAILSEFTDDVASIGGRVIKPQGESEVDGEHEGEEDQIVPSDIESHAIAQRLVECTSLISNSNGDDALTESESGGNAEDPLQDIRSSLGVLQETENEVENDEEETADEVDEHDSVLGDGVRVEEEGAEVGEGSTGEGVQGEEEEDGTEVGSRTNVLFAVEDQEDDDGENVGDEEADEIKHEVGEPVGQELETHDELKILGVVFTLLDDEGNE